MNWKLILNISVYIFIFSCSHAQEIVAPLDHNPLLSQKKKAKPLLKTTALSLPFFEDFTGYDIFPDASKWTDHSVYINNTMAVNPISRGVATFDALNAQGGPYDSLNFTTLLYADSLTSQPIDISLNVVSDSIYLSFFYQPQGNGFAPEKTDSLMLYFKNKNNAWIKIWSRADSTFQPFKQVMIPVTDTSYFHSGFQFRFVNKASINLNDDVWNVDYIRLAANRSVNDTAVSDVATTTQPANILNDYTSMPYRQFTANMNNELAAQHSFTVRNSYGTPRSVVYGYNAKESISNTILFSGISSNASLPANTEQSFQFPIYTINFAAPDLYSRVIFENKYFATQPVGVDSKTNDTILHEQIFDNYLAYDDGTAEKSYFLHQGNSLPAKTAIEFHLNQADTLRGVAIYFGRQVPLAFNKFFSVFVNKNIAVNGGVNDSLYQQDLLFPGYVDTVNHFWIYKFDTPVSMQPGTFFLGTIQPAQSGSDSLYFGLDVNRIGGNHLYINLLGFWQPSAVAGALMIRPVFGKEIIATDIVSFAKPKDIEWSLFPNPATDKLTIKINDQLKAFICEISDAQGRIILRKQTTSGQPVSISPLSPGIYFVHIESGNQKSSPKKIIKL